jgi:transposase
MLDTELLPKSKPEPVRQLEVFTGAGRRRAWTAEHKAEIIAESYVGGESVSAVARRHGLTPQQLFGWRRASRQGAVGGSCESGFAFAPVIVEGMRSGRSLPTAPGDEGGSALVEIAIGVATARVPPGTDAATLTMVLRAMRALM